MKDFEIRCDESRLETNHTIYGKFTLGPFLPGQGTTFGNVLRRSLLSELSGLAITAFEVLGIMQEFSTLPGLRESVLDLSLNLKQVALTGILPYSIPPIGFIKMRGPAVIKASDLQFPAGIYCTSPDQYIATLSSNGTLNLKFLVSVGKGYSTQPYSFYRSLSKVKLQSTFSSDIENNPLEKDYLGFSKEFFDQQKNEQNSFSESINTFDHSSGNFNNAKELENQSSADSTKLPQSLTTKGLRTPLPKAPKVIPSSCFLPVRSKKMVSVRSTSEVLATPLPKAPEVLLPLDTENSTPSTNIKDGKKQAQGSSLNKDEKGFAFEKTDNKAKNEINNSPLAPLDIELTRFSVSRKTDNVFPNQNKQKFLQSKNLEFLNPSSTKSMNERRTSNTFNSSRYVDIQTQIFQRVNPHQVLPIDAVFTPVSQVNFLTKVNDRFEIARENIVLEIWTNGSIHPKRALEEATLSLVQNFDILLKKIQQGSSFYKGLRYWNYLQSLDSANKKSPLINKLMADVSPANYETNVPYNNQEIETSNLFAIGQKSDIESSSRKYLHRAIYNLDIGNLDLSLETFILLKKAKINTLAQLLTHFSPQDNKIAINPKDTGVENSLFLSEKIVNELNNLINRFQFN